MGQVQPPAEASFVGQLMLELPSDSWLPDGYSLTPIAPKHPIPGYVPPAFLVTDPSGKSRMVFPDPNYVPPKPAQQSLLATIQTQLGPFQSDGFWTTKPIPPQILQAAKKLNIMIRDTNGKAF